MPTATLTCPHCSTSLTTTKPFAAGSRFRCPRCGAAFAVRPALPASGRREPAGSAYHQPAHAGRSPSSSGWLLLVGVAALSLLLLAGAGVVLALHFLQPRMNAPVASTTPGDKTGNNDPHDPVSAPPDLPPAAPPSAPIPPEPAWLPPEKQERVNAAIDRGVAYLEKMQYPGGTWDLQHQTGMAALPGLTLLECGVPPDDPHVQKTAQFVRGDVPKLNTTYELALAVLFLDRLGDPKDEPLIRTLALRLMAGQTATGGWSYNCPVLSEKDEGSLLTILQATRPYSSLDLTAARNGDAGIDNLFASRAGGRPGAPLGTIPLPAGPTDEEIKQARQLYDGLAPNLKGIPALTPPTGEDRIARGDNTDNSNTQFATLGLWAAGRHGVPMERSLALLGLRFQVSQDLNGAWDYRFIYRPQRNVPEGPSMTGAGLLGLAVGHGVTADLKGTDREAAGEDPRVEQGMKALAGFIQKMKAIGQIGGQQAGMYFLWSVERVGMLYGRRTIDGREWYPWGADLLLPAQKSDGSWFNPGYFGATPITDTCFALLFLKRANLAKDLTTKVEFLTQVKKP